LIRANAQLWREAERELHKWAIQEGVPNIQGVFDDTHLEQSSEADERREDRMIVLVTDAPCVSRCHERS
jgi:hypothetical protein